MWSYKIRSDTLARPQSSGWGIPFGCLWALDVGLIWGPWMADPHSDQLWLKGEHLIQFCWERKLRNGFPTLCMRFSTYFMFGHSFCRFKYDSYNSCSCIEQDFGQQPTYWHHPLRNGKCANFGGGVSITSHTIENILSFSMALHILFSLRFVLSFAFWTDASMGIYLMVLSL